MQTLVRWWSSKRTAASALPTLFAAAEERIISSPCPIEDHLASLVVAQLLYAEAREPEERDRHVHQFARRRVDVRMAIYERCSSFARRRHALRRAAASMGSLLLGRREPGLRYALRTHGSWCSASGGFKGRPATLSATPKNTSPSVSGSTTLCQGIRDNPYR